MLSKGGSERTEKLNTIVTRISDFKVVGKHKRGVKSQSGIHECPDDDNCAAMHTGG